MSNPKPRVSDRNKFIALAAIPSVDCILNQVYNAYHINFGPLSLLQIVRVFVMLAFAALIAWSLAKDRTGFGRIPIPAVAAGLLLAMAVTKELIVSNALSMASVGAYGQMAYWLMFWITVSVLCKNVRQAEIILWGLGVGATLTALSVIAGLMFGAINYYEDDAVRSSAGWFDTAKYVTGVLVCGGVVLLYLGRKNAGWLSPLLACLCFVACIITYARAGTVAMCAVFLWLAAWSLFIGNSQKRLWLNRFLILIFSMLMIAPLVVHPDTLFARWSDLQDSDKAGSGRATFWKVAADGYAHASPVQQTVGMGYSSMSEMLFIGYGDDIKHTHNDMLDMLLVGGVVGAAWLLLFISTLAWRVTRMSLATVEGCAGAGILLAYLFHSQLTGQLWGTDCMTYYSLSLTCLFAISRYSPRNATAKNPQLVPSVDPVSMGHSTWQYLT
jgi:O-antigen ligase